MAIRNINISTITIASLLIRMRTEMLLISTLLDSAVLLPKQLPKQQLQ